MHVRLEFAYKTIVVMRRKARQPLRVLAAATSGVDLKGMADAIGEMPVHIPTEAGSSA